MLPTSRLVFFAVPRFGMGATLGTLVGELVAVGVEFACYRRLAKLSLGQSGLLSVSANAVSFAAGLAFFMFPLMRAVL